MMNRILLAIAALAAAPGLAQAELILTCSFGALTISVEPRGDGFGLRLGERVNAAQLLEPGPDGSIVALTTMPEGGPVFLAIEAGGMGEKELQATMTMVTQIDTGLESTTIQGNCHDEGL